MMAEAKALKAIPEYRIRDIINYRAIEWSASEDFFF